VWRDDQRPRPSTEARRTVTAIEDIFASAQPVRTAEDLAHDGIFDDDDVDEFLSDLYAMRRSDIA